MFDWVLILEAKFGDDFLHLPWLIIKNVTCLIDIWITLKDVHINWPNWFLLVILKQIPLVILIDCMLFLSPFLDVMRMSCQQFFLCRVRLWNSLRAECLTYDLKNLNLELIGIFHRCSRFFSITFQYTCYLGLLYHLFHALKWLFRLVWSEFQFKKHLINMIFEDLQIL